ncbi:GNAT family acetyltransferase [Streptomyces sp. NPDC001276]|uniref:GNAT family acetyltransferase n=1 Tax=Streptomyces sp. NPDC001276 TaxID=3364555 RepID=UPI003689EEEB
MTIIITLPRFPVPAVTERGLRQLLPVAEPAILALADACGIGMPVSLLWLSIKLARSSTQR